MSRFAIPCLWVCLLCPSFANSEDNAAVIERARATVFDQWRRVDYFDALRNTGYGEPSVKAAMDASRRIRQEIEKLKKHPWAGLYYRGNRTPDAVEDILTLTPDNGFLYVREMLLNGESLAADLALGPIKEEKTAIALRATVSGKSLSQSVGDRLCPVKWGDRQYLVQEKELLDFCNAVNSGQCPMYGLANSGSWYFIRLGDESKLATGLPAVPNPYRRYLLRKPLSARIVKIDKSPKSKRGKDTIEGTATLDVGGKDGVLAGMKFHAHDKLLYAFQVANVSDTTCQAHYCSEFSDADSHPAPDVGWKLSTASFAGLAQQQVNRDFLTSRRGNEYAKRQGSK